MEKIVIVGTGIAALTAAETIKTKNPKMPVIMIGSEDYIPYNRMKLSKALTDNLRVEELYLKGQDWFVDNGIGIIKGAKVISIDVDNKTVETSTGLKIDYSKLIIANGSSPFIPKIDNIEIDGIFSIREFNDIENIKKYINDNKVKDVSVIGGGLLGIEAAYSLSSSEYNLNINIIQNSNRILSRQVDLEGGDILEKIMNKNSITVHKNAETQRFIGDSKVEAIQIQDGRTIQSQVVIISAGVRSNMSIANGTGIELGRGIKVNEFMESSQSDIYAAGDVAELNGKVLGLWPIATEQGRIAGLNSIGESTAYKEVGPSSMLMLMGINVFSIGDIGSDDLTKISYDEGTYTKLFFRDGIIVGAVLIYNPLKALAIKEAIQNRTSYKDKIQSNENIYSIL
ncbi:MAG: FAD-dependent oxidoreductase [Clostridium sp.]